MQEPNPNRSRATYERARAIFGNPRPPLAITEEQFDGDQEVLQALSLSDCSSYNKTALGAYLDDLAYVDLQLDLFRYVFPMCLAWWRDSLMRGESCVAGGAEFHYALLRGSVLARMLTDVERHGVEQFIRDAFLDRLDVERISMPPGRRDSAYSLITRFNSIGLVWPCIGEILGTWLAVPSIGAAVAALEYASGLMYLEDGNPLFPAWTPDLGGGGPGMWWHDADVYDAGWLVRNTEAIRIHLAPPAVIATVDRCCELLQGCPEIELALRVRADLPSCLGRLKSRCDELPARLAEVPARMGWDGE